MASQLPYGAPLSGQLLQSSLQHEALFSLCRKWLMKTWFRFLKAQYLCKDQDPQIFASHGPYSSFIYAYMDLLQLLCPIILLDSSLQVAFQLLSHISSLFLAYTVLFQLLCHFFLLESCFHQVFLLFTSFLHIPPHFFTFYLISIYSTPFFQLPPHLFIS